jgi:mannitol 2-dehydrogenase
MPTPLSQATLSQLPEEVARPAYDRTALKPGIVHIGLGNFHRAHMSWYMSQLFARGLDTDWAILGAGVRPTDAQMRERLEQQDWLSTLIELAPSGTRAEVVGSMIGFVPVEEGHAPPHRRHDGPPDPHRQPHRYRGRLLHRPRHPGL